MDKGVLRMGKPPFCNAILHKCDEGGDIVMKPQWDNESKNALIAHRIQKAEESFLIQINCSY